MFDLSQYQEHRVLHVISGHQLSMTIRIALLDKLVVSDALEGLNSSMKSYMENLFPQT